MSSFIALPGIGGHSRLMPSKLERVVRSSIEMVQKGHGQPMDIFLIGWRWSKWESPLSTFCFQAVWVWGRQAYGKHTVNFFHLVGILISVKQFKDMIMFIPWGGTRKLPQGCTIVSWLFFPCLSIHSLPFFFFFFISCRLITLQYCSGFCHTLKWISHGFTCVPHPDPPSHLPLYLIPLGLPSAPGPSACLMHPTWAGDLFHPR